METWQGKHFSITDPKGVNTVIYEVYVTKKEYLDMINKIRKVRPDISITTDVIVGFPQESETDFEECLDFCKTVNFANF